MNTNPDQLMKQIEQTKRHMWLFDDKSNKLIKQELERLQAVYNIVTANTGR